MSRPRRRGSALPARSHPGARRHRRPAAGRLHTGYRGDVNAGAAGETSRWWEADERLTVRLAGVFEGGGAKGVAYVGALQATREEGCWFSAVAGASAGAITAALIAAGLTPEEIAVESEEAFKRLRPGGV